jgi:hypothetical protein
VFGRVNPDRTVTQYTSLNAVGPMPVSGCPDVQDLFLAFSTTSTALNLGTTPLMLSNIVGEDIVLARVRPDGGVAWSRALVGDGNERAEGLAWASGRLFVYGECLPSAASSMCGNSAGDAGTFIVAFEP